MTKVIAIAGSIRNGSHNQKLALLMVKKLNAAGADATYVNLGDYELPIFNQDLEVDIPENAIALAKIFAEADAIFIASPEYNGSLSPLLKNTLDWISRQKFGSFSKPTFGIGAVSPGTIAGTLVLSHLRDILSKTGSLVAPTTLGVGLAAKAFDQSGELSNERVAGRAEALVTELLSIRRT